MEPVLDLVRDYGTFVYLLLFAYCALKSALCLCLQAMRRKPARWTL